VLTVLFLFKAIFAGFIVAVPVGPIGAIVMRRALHGRWASGLVTGLGAAAADAVLAAVAGLGLTLVLSYLREHESAIRFFGGLLLIYFGVRMLVQHPPHLPQKQPDETLNGRRLRILRESSADFSGGFLLTIINPATFVAFMGVFAALDLFVSEAPTVISSALLILGVFVGSALWWLTLALASAAVRTWLSYSLIEWINRVLGVLVIGFGLVTLLSVFDLPI
jgi:threonine/homoserine/homoserine lactone efflux protein